MEPTRHVILGAQQWHPCQHGSKSQKTEIVLAASPSQCSRLILFVVVVVCMKASDMSLLMVLPHITKAASNPYLAAAASSLSKR